MIYGRSRGVTSGEVNRRGIIGDRGGSIMPEVTGITEQNQGADSFKTGATDTFCCLQILGTKRRKGL